MIPRILIVEDYPPQRRALRRVLEREGFQCVDVAVDGLTAAARAGGGQYAVVLADIGLPDMGADVLLEELSLHGVLDDTLVIACSGHEASHPAVQRAVGLGAVFLPKPIDPLALVAHIHEFLRRRDA
jgi:DNA-binding response OmpR family regulator